MRGSMKIAINGKSLKVENTDVVTLRFNNDEDRILFATRLLNMPNKDDYRYFTYQHIPSGTEEDTQALHDANKQALLED